MSTGVLVCVVCCYDDMKKIFHEDIEISKYIYHARKGGQIAVVFMYTQIYKNITASGINRN